MKSRPGFPHDDISWLQGLLAIRAPLACIKELESTKPQKRTRDVQGFQIEGSDYTLLRWEKCEPEFAKQASKKLRTTVAYLWDEDTSGWFGYSIFKNGVEIEAFQYGSNYEDELSEFAEELGDIYPSPAKRKKGWDILFTKSGEDFQFRSKIAKFGKKDIVKKLRFVDVRFKALGISIPREKDFPEDQEAFAFPRK